LARLSLVKPSLEPRRCLGSSSGFTRDRSPNVEKTVGLYADTLDLQEVMTMLYSTIIVAKTRS
jgi:hypothetical protein